MTRLIPQQALFYFAIKLCSYYLPALRLILKFFWLFFFLCLYMEKRFSTPFQTTMKKKYIDLNF